MIPRRDTSNLLARIDTLAPRPIPDAFPHPNPYPLGGVLVGYCHACGDVYDDEAVDDLGRCQTCVAFATDRAELIAEHEKAYCHRCREALHPDTEPVIGHLVDDPVFRFCSVLCWRDARHCLGLDRSVVADHLADRKATALPTSLPFNARHTNGGTRNAP